MIMDSQNRGNADSHMKIMDMLAMEKFNVGIDLAELDDIIAKNPWHYHELEFEDLDQLYVSGGNRRNIPDFFSSASSGKCDLL